MKKENIFKKFMIGLTIIGLVLGFGLYNVTATNSSDSLKDLKTPGDLSNSTFIYPNNFTELAQKVRPGVVNIQTVKNIKNGGPVLHQFFGNPFGGRPPFDEFFGPNQNRAPQYDFKQRSLGSGFILDKEGYIVTNNHVIDGADQIKIRFADGKEIGAKIIGGDSKTDLALIKIEGSKDLVPLEFGNSDSLKVGSWVVAVGSPFGLEQTVTAGIVSAKGRTIGAGPYDDFIQTDASINPGNSGGPLINMNGEVIGINTAIVPSGQGIGFAIPSDMAKGILEQLKNNGTVNRGWLGVVIQDLTPELREYYDIKDQKGVLVTQINKGDPADNAGIKQNDIILSINGKNVQTIRELSRNVADSPLDKKIPIEIHRDGQEKTLYAKLITKSDNRVSQGPEVEKKSDLGLELAQLNPQIAQRLGYNEKEKGILVTGVQMGSKSSQAGIQRGDLIKEVNHREVTEIDEFGNLINGAKSGEAIHFLIKRPNAGIYAVKIVV